MNRIYKLLFAITLVNSSFIFTGPTQMQKYIEQIQLWNARVNTVREELDRLERGRGLLGNKVGQAQSRYEEVMLELGVIKEGLTKPCNTLKSFLVIVSKAPALIMQGYLFQEDKMQADLEGIKTRFQALINALKQEEFDSFSRDLWRNHR